MCRCKALTCRFLLPNFSSAKFLLRIWTTLDQLLSEKKEKGKATEVIFRGEHAEHVRANFQSLFLKNGVDI